MNLVRELESLTDAMLLAVLLDPYRQTANYRTTANRLLKRFGGFRGLLRAESVEVGEVEGMDDTRVATIAALGAITTRYLDEEIANGPFIGHSRDVQRILAARYRDLKREAFAVVYLDTRHHVLSVETLFTGDLNSSTVHPREIIRRALELNAAALVAVHNHPSGNPAPSPDDRQVTREIQRACGLMNISLLDHLVIGGNDCFSFAEHRLL